MALLAAAVAFAPTAQPSASACTIPVFLYSMERWEPEAYRVTIFHRGQLGEAAAKTINAIEAEGIRGIANIDVELVDLAEEVQPEVQELWSRQDHPAAPWMVVRLPESETTVWAGPLNEASAQALTNSPKRKEIAKRLIGGDSAVWVLLESSDKVKDDAAERLLQAELSKAAQSLAPALLKRMRDSGLDEEEAKSIRVAFSVLRISRADPAERLLVAMLMHCEDDLAQYAGEPMVFPIFGRGRALTALVGRGIRHDNVQEICEFILGECSCEVKEDNPGMDLLMSADWSRGAATDYVSVAEVGPLTGLDLAASTSQPATAAATEPSAEVDRPVGIRGGAWPLRNALWAAGIILAIAVTCGIVVVLRTNRRKTGSRP